MIKCACDKEGCSGAIWFDGNHLYFTNDVLKKKAKEGKIISELSIILDANTLVELIKEASGKLLRLSEGD